MRKIFAIESQNPPLGLLYLASSLEKNEHKVEIIDFCCEKFTEEKLKKAIENIDAVGLTVRSYGVNSVSYIIDFIKKQNENIITIVGGPHCTLDPEKALVDTHADICVEGDGEIALAKIVGSLVRNEELSNIPGVFYKKDEKIIRGPPAEVIMDLDSLPYPNRDLVYKYSYGAVQNDIKLGKGKVTEIMISRGCPYNCRFCTNKAITKKYRTRSAENVIEEIKLISKKYDFLFILDDNFFVDMKKSLKILDAIIEEKLDLEMAIAGIRVDANR